MDDFKNFLKENNYENDLEFQLCDLEMAFNAGRELQWKPSEEQIGVIEAVINNRSFQRRHLDSLYEQLKILKGE